MSAEIEIFSTSSQISWLIVQSLVRFFFVLFLIIASLIFLVVEVLWFCRELWWFLCSGLCFPFLVLTIDRVPPGTWPNLDELFLRFLKIVLFLCLRFNHLLFGVGVGIVDSFCCRWMTYIRANKIHKNKSETQNITQIRFQSDWAMVYFVSSQMLSASDLENWVY